MSKKEDRIATVKDLLHCDDLCSKKAYDKILDMWSTEHVENITNSRSISSFTTDELTLMNRLFGSAATCYPIKDRDLQKLILRLIPLDLYQNFRRATYKRPMTVTVEDWIWEGDGFSDELDIELTCLENVIVSFVLYLLGGFAVPIDDKKAQMDKWVKVDVYSLFHRPRELFLLTSLAPSILARYLYWKTTSILMGLMRLFSNKITMDRVDNVVNKLIELGHVTQDKDR